MEDEAGMRCIAFGPADSFFARPKDADFPPFWTSSVVAQFKKEIAYIAFNGTTGYYAQFTDGTVAYKLHPELGCLIDRCKGVHWITFGNDGSYVLQGKKDGSVHWWNIPDELEKLLERESSRLVSCSLGQGDSYFTMFDNDYHWSGVPPSLDAILSKQKIGKTQISSVDAVWLSAYDCRYYLEYNGGSAYWFGCCDYFDSMMKCDKMLDPQQILYTQDAISATFSDGRSIYDTARDLNDGSLDVTELPTLQVFRRNERYFSINNRRLWSIRNSGVKVAPVMIVAAPARFSGKDLVRRKEIYVRYKTKTVLLSPCEDQGSQSNGRMTK